MKNILLITNGFPFGESERSFLQTEFECLKENYHISILAVSNKVQKIIYPLDESVDVYSFIRNKLNKKQILKVCFKKILWTEIIRAMKKTNLRTFVQRCKLIAGYVCRSEELKREIQKIKEKHDINMIYTYWCTQATLAALFFKTKETDLKVITRFHGYDLYVERTGAAMWQPFRSVIADEADRLIFISKTAKEYFLQHWTVPDKGKCIVAYLGTKPYQTVSPSEKKNVLSLVSCSNVIDIKRIDLIIDALAVMPERYHIQWTHIGDGNLMEQLKGYAKKMLEGKKHISWEFMGRVPNNEIENIYKRLGVGLFITTSSTEGSPVSVQEALAMGIPVIGTAVGGIPELIYTKTGNAGFLLDENPSISNIVQAICGYMDASEDQKYEWRRNALCIWRQTLDARKNAGYMVKVIEQTF